jgi:hypothetical protein
VLAAACIALAWWLRLGVGKASSEALLVEAAGCFGVAAFGVFAM